MADWDFTFDLVVVGSGGAAMTFAYLAALDAAETPLVTERPVMQEV